MAIPRPGSPKEGPKKLGTRVPEKQDMGPQEGDPSPPKRGPGSPKNGIRVPQKWGPGAGSLQKENPGFPIRGQEKSMLPWVDVMEEPYRIEGNGLCLTIGRMLITVYVRNCEVGLIVFRTMGQYPSTASGIDFRTQDCSFWDTGFKGPIAVTVSQ